MKQSRLTIRTLGLAVVALMMACVHAAMGDGRSGVSTFKGTSGKAATGGRGSSEVATIKGDPWQFSDTRLAMATSGPTQPRQSQAARNAAAKYRQDKSKARAAGGGSTAKAESICVVRRAGDPTPLRPQPPKQEDPPAATSRSETAVASAEPVKPAASQNLTRNAFALSPIMGAR